MASLTSARRRGWRRRRARRCARAIAAAAALMARAESAGDHGRRRGAAEQRARPNSSPWPKLLGAPVYDEGMASRAMFPSSHPLYRGSVRAAAGGDPRHAEPARPAGLDRRRSVHPVAARRGRSAAGGHADRPSRHRSVGTGQELSAEQVAILGDPKATLPELTEAVAACTQRSRRPRMRARGWPRCRRRRGRAWCICAPPPKPPPERTPIHPLALMQAIGRPAAGRGGGDRRNDLLGRRAAAVPEKR